MILGITFRNVPKYKYHHDLSSAKIMIYSNLNVDTSRQIWVGRYIEKVFEGWQIQVGLYLKAGFPCRAILKPRNVGNHIGTFVIRWKFHFSATLGMDVWMDITSKVAFFFGRPLVLFTHDFLVVPLSIIRLAAWRWKHEWRSAIQRDPVAGLEHGHLTPYTHRPDGKDCIWRNVVPPTNEVTIHW